MPDDLFKDMSDAELDALTTNTGKSSYEIPGTGKRKKYDPNERTVSNWFKLPHALNMECEVPNHDEEREARNKPRMYFQLESGLWCCRWCFVESRDLAITE